MTYVLSVGGSLLAPSSGVDLKFIKSFRNFVQKRLARGDRLIVVAGGGSTAREYVRAAASNGANVYEQDYVGILATRLNAELLRASLRPWSSKQIIIDPLGPINKRSRLLVAGGYKPGRSTDYVAVMLARRYGAKTVINLSNIDYVRVEDPHKNPEAGVITDIDWIGFRRIVGDNWRPGMNSPFDPVASKEAQKIGLTVAIINGAKLANLQRFVDGKSFEGTIIHD